MRGAASPGITDADSKTCVVARRLEELDRVARGVLDQDLLAADACDDLVPEGRARLAQFLHRRLEILDLELEAVPAAGLGHCAGWHRLTAAARPSAGRAQRQPQVAASEHREGRSGTHDLLEAEHPAVEVDGGIDIVDDVADADCGHAPKTRPLRLRALRLRVAATRRTLSPTAHGRSPTSVRRPPAPSRCGRSCRACRRGCRSCARAWPRACTGPPGFRAPTARGGSG